MKKVMKHLLDELKVKVTNNINVIRENEKAIREALAMTDNSVKNQILNQKFEQNRGLLNKNLDYLEIQRKVVHLIDKFRTNEIENEGTNLLLEASKHIYIDFWALTIDGTMPINTNHPMIKNEEFYNKLINYYIESEEYEKCAEIKLAAETA